MKQILEASYLDPAPNEINGYTLNNKLSNLYGKVYVNTNLKKVVVSFRGTKEATDWTNNAVFVLSSSAYTLTDRFKHIRRWLIQQGRNTKDSNLNLMGTVRVRYLSMISVVKHIRIVLA